MESEGIAFGKALDAAARTAAAGVLVSNSGRFELAETVKHQIEKHRPNLIDLGCTESEVDIFEQAAKRQVNWLGV